VCAGGGGTTYSVLLEFSGPLFPSSLSIVRLMESPLPCSLWTYFDTSFHTPFFGISQCPTWLIGRDILLKFNATLYFNSPPQTLLAL
jgi:hypothetical protein